MQGPKKAEAEAALGLKQESVVCFGVTEAGRHIDRPVRRLLSIVEAELDRSGAWFRDSVGFDVAAARMVH